MLKSTITPTIIVPTDHGFWKPRGGVLGFIAGWLVGPYAAAGPLAENGRKNDAGISAQWRLSYLSVASSRRRALSTEGVPRGLIQPRGRSPEAAFERGRGALSGLAEGGLLRSHREHCRAHSLS